MAQVTNDNGRMRILVMVDGKRRSVPVGHIGEDAAREIADNLQHLADIRAYDTPNMVRDDVTAWLIELQKKNVEFYDKIAGIGLAPKRAPVEAQQVVTLGGLCARVQAEYAASKATTRDLYKRFFDKPLAHFGAGRDVTTIKPADADAFVAELRKTLAQATVSRSVKAYRLLFKRALRWGFVTCNPFDGIKAGAMTNHSRKQYVPVADFEKVLAAETSAEFRALLALCRYGALRCPSEVFALRWADVRFDERKLIVRSPKTEHHAGGESRILPLFPELADALLAWYTDAPEGVEYVINMHRDKGYRVNFRQRVERLIVKAGVKPWGKLFHNLRASRESELVERYPLATVAAWLGHAPEVAAAHYLTQTDADGNFADAIAHRETVRQSVRADGKRSQNMTKQKAGNPTKSLENQAFCEVVASGEAHPVGVEQPAKHWHFDADSKNGAPVGARDPDLAAVVAAWPRLTAEVRQAIVKAAQTGAERTEMPRHAIGSDGAGS
jgi:integrase